MGSGCTRTMPTRKGGNRCAVRRWTVQTHESAAKGKPHRRAFSHPRGMEPIREVSLMGSKSNSRFDLVAHGYLWRRWELLSAIWACVVYALSSATTFAAPDSGLPSAHRRTCAAHASSAALRSAAKS